MKTVRSRVAVGAVAVGLSLSVLLGAPAHANPYKSFCAKYPYLRPLCPGR